MKLPLLTLLFLPVSLLAQHTVGLFLQDSNSYNGYTLFAALDDTTYLIDNCGKQVHSWESDYPPGASAYLLADGSLLRAARISNPIFSGGGSGGRVERFNWEGDLIWSYNFSNTNYHQHHDIEYMPNGNLLLLCWKKLEEGEAVALGRKPSTITEGSLWPTYVIEVEMIGTDSMHIVWEWFLADHVIQDYDNTKANYGVVADHPELMDINYDVSGGAADWIHMNSISYNEVLDQIVLSSRNTSEIWIIDHSTTTEEAASHSGGNSGKGGDLLYRWGNPQVYKRGGPADQQFFNQHDADWVTGYPDETNYISVFNNSKATPSGSKYSAVEVIIPPLGLSGHYTSPMPTYGPDSAAWSFHATNKANFYSPHLSGAQRLPNGNMLICSSKQGAIFEVTYTGDSVWNYIVPVSISGPVNQGDAISGNEIFRAYRYGTDYPAFTGKDLTPGLPIEKNPLPYDCFLYEEEDTATNLQPIADINAWVNNPFGDELVLISAQHIEAQVFIYSINGSLVLRETMNSNKLLLNTSSLEKGMYLLRLQNADGSILYSKKMVKL